MLLPEFISQLRSLLPSDRLYTDPIDCYAYSYDNSRKIFPPETVVFPLTTDEIVSVVTLCNDYQVPLTPRGRGTGTAGGSLPVQGGVALSLERMLQIIKVDPANRVIITEPGVLNQSIQDAALGHGFSGHPTPQARLIVVSAVTLPPRLVVHMPLNTALLAITS